MNVWTQETATLGSPPYHLFNSLLSVPTMMDGASLLYLTDATPSRISDLLVPSPRRIETVSPKPCCSYSLVDCPSIYFQSGCSFPQKWHLQCPPIPQGVIYWRRGSKIAPIWPHKFCCFPPFHYHFRFWCSLQVCCLCSDCAQVRALDIGNHPAGYQWVFSSADLCLRPLANLGEGQDWD